MASYYDRILEDFDFRESESSYDEGILDEGILDEGVYDEGSYDEARTNRRRPVRVAPSLRKPSNFGRNVSPAPAQNGQGNFVTKSELRSSLNSISEQVNDIKKSSLNLATSIKRLDDGYEKVVKSIARKDRAQDNVMSGSTMMSLMSTLVNKPTLNADALEIVKGTAAAGTTITAPDRIQVKQGQDAIQVDLTKTLLFTMMPSMMSGSTGGGDNNMMTMLMMVLLLDKNKTGSTGNTNDNTLLLMIPMMMMNKR